MKEKKTNNLPFIAVLCYCQWNFHVISRETEWFVDFFFLVQISFQILVS